MEKIIWPTTSVWFDETLELFKNISAEDNPVSIAKKVKNGDIFGDMKETTAKRVWGTINARYFGQGGEKASALRYIFNSNISKQEKQNYALVFYIEYENLFRIFLEEYIFNNFTELCQKTFTQMDLDKFLEYITIEKKEQLPLKLQDGISDSSIKKVRNMLYKNIETLGWGTIENSKLTIRRPSLTPEWFTFLLYYFFDDKVITKNQIYDSGVMKRFLLNEYDIEYLLTGAKMKHYIEVSQLGDICNITKEKEGIVEYAKTYR
ncbi:BrxA family protein [Bariatricus sp. HCP28S3_A7]|uniref:BrxA family protein n=1 Tax=Bariatricus sp. HCP28S3_A7 TaxID=3438894 RepID=UPI003F8B7C18